MKSKMKLIFWILALSMSFAVFAYVLSSNTALGYAAIIFITPAVVAFFMMRAKLSQMKTAHKQNYADNYFKRDSLNITRSKDVFLYSNTVKRPKPKDKN